MTRHESLGLRLALDPAAGNVRVAFSTPKRIGSAVVRNKLRRQLRALMHERSSHLPAGWYLLAVEPSAVDKNWGQLGTALDSVLAAAMPGASGLSVASTSKGLGEL
jgi:ribonuclease P protein component